MRNIPSAGYHLNATLSVASHRSATRNTQHGDHLPYREHVIRTKVQQLNSTNNSFLRRPPKALQTLLHTVDYTRREVANDTSARIHQPAQSPRLPPGTTLAHSNANGWSTQPGTNATAAYANPEIPVCWVHIKLLYGAAMGNSEGDTDSGPILHGDGNPLGWKRVAQLQRSHHHPCDY